MIKFKLCREADTDTFKHGKSVMVVCDGGLVKLGYVDYDYYSNGHGQYIVRFSDGSTIPIVGMHYYECEMENY